MTKIKTASTIQQNKQIAVQRCAVTYTMEKIGSYWKPIIIYHLSKGEKRYGELRKAIPDITEKVLIQQLKQLEADGLIIREARPVVPPHVTYKLSKTGIGLLPVMDAMESWGRKDMKRLVSGN